MGIHREWITLAEAEPVKPAKRRLTGLEMMLILAIALGVVWLGLELLVLFG